MKNRSFVLLVLFLGLLSSAGCSQLPSLEGRVPSHALHDGLDTRLTRATAADVAAHPELSGVYPLGEGRSAFAARRVLIEAADRALDVQYYIWHDDVTGALLLDGLRRAAERGVRVRLLLDDNGIAGLDPVLAALDALPTVEVRLYNPFLQRGFRPLGYLTDFQRLNRRMHNKSLIADGAVAIIGGRNVGDEYFGAGEGVNFADLDLLAIGRVVADVSDVFDRYWNSESAYPLGLIVESPGGDASRLLADRLAELGGNPATAEYIAALRESTLVRDLLEGRLPLERAPTQVVADDPAKTLARGSAVADTSMLPGLSAAIGKPTQKVDVVSPYFVPGEIGTARFAELARRGVAVRVLTNSLAATDVAAVHAGYAKRRKALLESGVRLFELKPTSTPEASLGDWARALGGSGASLHAKTFAVDGQHAFVGSFNFDPRSAALNTEMGFVVESPTLARAVHEAFETIVPQIAYEVRLDAQGELEWVDHGSATGETLRSEPGVGAVKRGTVKVLSWLPIDGLL